MIDAVQAFVSTTVLLESERVLRGVHAFAREEVAAALRAFSGLPGVSVESPALQYVELPNLFWLGRWDKRGFASVVQPVLPVDPRRRQPESGTPHASSAIASAPHFTPSCRHLIPPPLTALTREPPPH